VGGCCGCRPGSSKVVRAGLGEDADAVQHSSYATGGRRRTSEFGTLPGLSMRRGGAHAQVVGSIHGGGEWVSARATQPGQGVGEYA